MLVGLEIDEYPVLGPVDHAIIENMNSGVGVEGIADTFLTAARGAERLTRLEQEIRRV